MLTFLQLTMHTISYHIDYNTETWIQFILINVHILKPLGDLDNLSSIKCNTAAWERDQRINTCEKGAHTHACEQLTWTYLSNYERVYRYAELSCFLWSAPEQMVKQTNATLPCSLWRHCNWRHLMTSSWMIGTQKQKSPRTGQLRYTSNRDSHLKIRAVRYINLRLMDFVWQRENISKMLMKYHCFHSSSKEQYYHQTHTLF